MSNLPPVLLTSSVIAMDHSVRLKDEGLRIFHTLESIKEWLKINPNGRYVLCDGSGYDFSPLIIENFPDANIECIFFINNTDLILKHGKGFGEGEIILYALEHSQTLDEAQWFAKCTAKLWVDNFWECLDQWNKQFLCQAFFSNVFSLKKPRLEYIDTRFYLVNKCFYQAHLSRAHIGLGGVEKRSIEDRFLEIAIREQLSGFLFEAPPIVCGVGGGSGKYYKDSKTRRLKEKLRSWIISHNSKFEPLFNKR